MSLDNDMGMCECGIGNLRPKKAHAHGCPARHPPKRPPGVKVTVDSTMENMFKTDSYQRMLDMEKERMRVEGHWGEDTTTRQRVQEGPEGPECARCGGEPTSGLEYSPFPSGHTDDDCIKYLVLRMAELERAMYG